MSFFSPTTAVPTDQQSAAMIPTIFADGVLNLSNSKFVVKFYLARFDPSPAVANKTVVEPSVQIVMPMDGFVTTFAFLERSLQELIKQGIVQQSDLEQARNALAQRGRA